MPFRGKAKNMLSVNSALERLVAEALTAVHVEDMAVMEDGIF